MLFLSNHFKMGYTVFKRKKCVKTCSTTKTKNIINFKCLPLLSIYFPKAQNCFFQFFLQYFLMIWPIVKISRKGYSSISYEKLIALAVKYLVELRKIMPHTSSFLRWDQSPLKTSQALFKVEKAKGRVNSKARNKICIFSLPVPYSNHKHTQVYLSIPNWSWCFMFFPPSLFLFSSFKISF